MVSRHRAPRLRRRGQGRLALLPVRPDPRPSRVVAARCERPARASSCRERLRAGSRRTDVRAGARRRTQRGSRAARGVDRVPRTARLRARDGLRRGHVDDRDARRAARAAQAAMVDRGDRRRDRGPDASGRRVAGRTGFGRGHQRIQDSRCDGRRERAQTRLHRARGGRDRIARRRRRIPRVGRASERRSPVSIAGTAGVVAPRRVDRSRARRVADGA